MGLLDSDLAPVLGGLLGKGWDRFRGVDPATGEADYWRRGGIAGLLGMPSWDEQSKTDIAMGFAGSTTPKIGRALDWSDAPLSQVQTALARRMGASKIGEGKGYDPSGARVYGRGGDKSRYYKLPDGLEMRISGHADVNRNSSRYDLVVDPVSGEVTLNVNPKLGSSGKPESYYFVRDDPKVTLDVSGQPIGNWHGFEGDGAAWTGAVLQRLRDLGIMK